MFNHWMRGTHPWSHLWDELSRLQREVSRQLPAALSRPGRDVPAINLWITQEGALLTAELPGVRREDLDLRVAGNVATLAGERKNPAPEGAQYQRRECPEGRFSRTFDLPFAVEPGGVEARLADGVLHVRLPRAESDKPRKISIQAEK
jgi:HSP20 family protein